MNNMNENNGFENIQQEIEELLEFLEHTMEHISALQDFMNGEMQTVKAVKHTLPARPSVIIFSSDIHFGSFYTNYAELTELYKLLMDADSNVYVVLNGDVIDNFDVFAGMLAVKALNSQVIPPVYQRAFLTRLLRALSYNKKLLGFVIGNHEEFSQLEFLKGANAPIGLNRLTIKLHFENAFDLTIACVHKSRFNSFLNPIHSSLRELMLLYPYADIVVTSHTHTPAIMSFPYPSEDGYKNRWLIKTGSLKDLDPYTYKYFSPYPQSGISTPAVLVLPYSRQVIGFNDYRIALNVLSLFEEKLKEVKDA